MDEFCGDPSRHSGFGGTAVNPIGPNPDYNQCTDAPGKPVALASGNVTIGPIPLVSIAGPSGTPLALSLFYNSHGTRGAFGNGWRLNLEQAVSTEGGDLRLPDGGTVKRLMYVDGRATTMTFSEPTDVALDISQTPPVVDPARMVHAQSPNLASAYITQVGWELTRLGCAGGPGFCGFVPLVRARVALEDGTQVQFRPDGGLDSFELRGGTTQGVSFIPTPGLPSWPGVELSEGDRKVAVSWSALAGITAPRTAIISYSIGGVIAAPAATTAVDANNNLTDICVSGKSTVVGCAFGRGACELDQHFLWHFEYAATGGVSDVVDESCAIVEHHDYTTLPNGLVVPTTSEDGRNALTFNWTVQSGAGASPSPFASVDITQPNFSSAAASGVTAGLGTEEWGTATGIGGLPQGATLDAHTGRVATTRVFCEGMDFVERTWTSQASQAHVSVLRQGDLRTTWTRTPG